MLQYMYGWVYELISQTVHSTRSVNISLQSFRIVVHDINWVIKLQWNVGDENKLEAFDVTDIPCCTLIINSNKHS
jgi:hypothetical protein